jgi:hypothetical protein
MNLADLFSGGQDSAAADVIQGQLDKLNAIQTPTAAQLTLPQLQQFVNAGIMTPEEAQSYLAGPTNYSTLTSENSGMDAEQEAIGKLRDIVNSGGADAEEQANIQQILNTLSTTESGNNAAIVADNARRGVGNSGLTMASRLASNQNDATNANMNALQTGAAEEARNLAAIEGLGTLGGNVQGQEYTAGANKASAADAIAKFNAQQEQDISKVNATATNAAKAANLANAQDIANKNTVSAQTQEASIPAAQQQAYQDALNKAAAGMSGADSLANIKETTGQQNAGILGGLIGTAGTVASSYLSGNPYASLASALAKNNSATPGTNTSTSSVGGVSTAATGGEIVPGGVARPMNFKAGGPVPGEPMVPGDSPANDTQLAKLSPGEIVLPRSVTDPASPAGPDPSKVMEFLKSLPKPQARPSIHPKAVLDTLRGLSMHHAGVM